MGASDSGTAAPTETPARTNLTILIPAYNEEDRLPPTLKTVLDWRRTSPLFHAEIIVIDDGSADRTSEIVREAISQNPDVRLLRENHVGFMNALLSGFANARYDLIGIVEADCPVQPRVYESFLPLMKQHDIVIGSRKLRGDLPPVEKSFFRKVLSFGMSSLFLTMFRPRIYDPQIGFALYKREVIEKVVPLLALKHDGLKRTELLIKAYGLGYSIGEVPVDFRHDEASRCVPKGPMRVVFAATMALFVLWLQTCREYRKGMFVRNPVRGSLFAPLLSLLTGHSAGR